MSMDLSNPAASAAVLSDASKPPAEAAAPESSTDAPSAETNADVIPSSTSIASTSALASAPAAEDVQPSASMDVKEGNVSQADGQVQGSVDVDATAIPQDSAAATSEQVSSGRISGPAEGIAANEPEGGDRIDASNEAGAPVNDQDAIETRVDVPVETGGSDPAEVASGQPEGQIESVELEKTATGTLSGEVGMIEHSAQDAIPPSQNAEVTAKSRDSEVEANTEANGVGETQLQGQTEAIATEVASMEPAGTESARDQAAPAEVKTSAEAPIESAATLRESKATEPEASSTIPQLVAEQSDVPAIDGTTGMPASEPTLQEKQDAKEAAAEADNVTKSEADAFSASAGIKTEQSKVTDVVETIERKDGIEGKTGGKVTEDTGFGQMTAPGTTSSMPSSSITLVDAPATSSAPDLVDVGVSGVSDVNAAPPAESSDAKVPDATSQVQPEMQAVEGVQGLGDQPMAVDESTGTEQAAAAPDAVAPAPSDPQPEAQEPGKDSAIAPATSSGTTEYASMTALPPVEAVVPPSTAPPQDNSAVQPDSIAGTEKVQDDASTNQSATEASELPGRNAEGGSKRPVEVASGPTSQQPEASAASTSTQPPAEKAPVASTGSSTNPELSVTSATDATAADKVSVSATTNDANAASSSTAATSAGQASGAIPATSIATTSDVSLPSASTSISTPAPASISEPGPAPTPAPTSAPTSAPVTLPSTSAPTQPPAQENIPPSVTAPAPAVTEKPAPATSAPEASAPPAVNSSQEETKVTLPEGEKLLSYRIALLLKINREIIKVCVEQQNQGSYAIEKNVDLIARMQSNLAYLAFKADPSKIDRDGPIPRLESFDETKLPPGSTLPALYSQLQSLFHRELLAQAEAKGKKRAASDAFQDEAAAAAKRQAVASPMPNGLGNSKMQGASIASTPGAYPQGPRGSIPGQALQGVIGGHPLSAQSPSPVPPGPMGVMAQVGIDPRRSSSLSSGTHGSPAAVAAAAVVAAAGAGAGSPVQRHLAQTSAGFNQAGTGSPSSLGIQAKPMQLAPAQPIPTAAARSLHLATAQPLPTAVLQRPAAGSPKIPLTQPTSAAMVQPQIPGQPQMQPQVPHQSQPQVQAQQPIQQVPQVPAQVQQPQQGQPLPPQQQQAQASSVPSFPALNPQQAQSLQQMFGPNAVGNYNMLQLHLRGQPQAFLTYMEQNMPNFRQLPMQVQLQQMQIAQNNAVQRQRQAQLSQAQGRSVSGTPPPTQSPYGTPDGTGALNMSQQQIAQKFQGVNGSPSHVPVVGGFSPSPRLNSVVGGPLSTQGSRPSTPAQNVGVTNMHRPSSSAGGPPSHLMRTRNPSTSSSFGVDLAQTIAMGSPLRSAMSPGPTGMTAQSPLPPTSQPYSNNGISVGGSGAMQQVLANLQQQQSQQQNFNPAQNVMQPPGFLPQQQQQQQQQPLQQTRPISFPAQSALPGRISGQDLLQNPALAAAAEANMDPATFLALRNAALQQQQQQQQQQSLQTQAPQSFPQGQAQPNIFQNLQNSGFVNPFSLATSGQQPGSSQGNTLWPNN